jgi:serine/threonine protein kinase
MYAETGKQFGEGAFGKVVEVVDATGKRFAKKTCTRENYMYNTDYEKTCMDALKHGNTRHRGYHHVVQLEAAERNSVNTGWILIMECYEGNLLELMESFYTYDEGDNETLNALPEAILRDLALHASFGLAYMTELGYAHCDLKPENILWKKSTQTKSGYHFSIADFGNVLEKMDRYTSIQTRQYMCTENLLGVASVTGCDMPSLACILYEAIVGDYLANHKHRPRHISAHLDAIGKNTLDMFDSKEIPAIQSYLGNVTSKRGHLAHPVHPLQKAMVRAGYIFSKDITDLITFMLIPYPQQRIKAKNVCKHAWFEEEEWWRMTNPLILEPELVDLCEDKDEDKDKDNEPEKQDKDNEKDKEKDKYDSEKDKHEGNESEKQDEDNEKDKEKDKYDSEKDKHEGNESEKQDKYDSEKDKYDSEKNKHEGNESEKQDKHDSEKDKHDEQEQGIKKEKNKHKGQQKDTFYKMYSKTMSTEIKMIIGW